MGIFDATNVSAQQELIGMLKSELKVVISPAAKMEGDNDQTHFYTGLPSYAVFSSLLDLLLSIMSKRTSHELSPQDQFLLVLMKLKLAVPSKDLGYRFSISPTRVSQIFHESINIMSRELKLIKWPDRELIRKTLPDCFKFKYPRVTCIIDCSEVFIERELLHFLLEVKLILTTKAIILPNSWWLLVQLVHAIIFISKCWGGWASDKTITSKCGFLDRRLSISRQRFDIVEDLALRGAALAIPSFTKGKSQLSQREVETSRELSRVRIHIE